MAGKFITEDVRSDPLISKLQKVDANRLLSAIPRRERSKRMPVRLERNEIASLTAETARALGLSETQTEVPLLTALESAERAVDAKGDIGLTVSVKEMRIRDPQEGFLAGDAEVYVVGSILDGSGEQPDFKTKIFQGIRENHLLPLGEGGMLVGMVKNPRWFVDMHLLVMESDTDIRAIGEAIEEAREKSGLPKLVEAVGNLAAFNPVMIGQLTSAVDLFLSLLSSILKSNGDDHIATLHDFYLKGQGFGAGRHPPTGSRFLGGADVIYQIDLTDL